MSHNNYLYHDAPLGVSRVARATDGDFFAFFQAAYVDVNDQTKKHQFGLSLSIPQLDINPNTPPQILDTVEIHSLTSEKGKILNGQRGEIIPPLPTTQIAHADTRW